VRAYYTAGAMPLPGSTAPPTPTPTPAPAPDFALALTPAQLVIARGASGTFTITLTTQGGFAAPVSLSSTSAPSLNGSRTLGTKQLSSPGTTTLRISVSRTASRRTYTITLKGVGGGLTRTATATVVVK
jgi:serine protease AprX